MKQLKFPEKLAPFKGVILFMVILFISNFFWKYNIKGDESNGLNSIVTFWGMDITAPFVWMARHVAHIAEHILNLIGYPAQLSPENILGYANGNSVIIIWACTGIKQAYIYVCIIAFNRGPWQKKLWFIPLGLLAIYLFNLFRITFIGASIQHHPQWFDFLHLYAFKYSFYLLIFLIWVVWEEKLAGKPLSGKPSGQSAQANP